MIKIKCLGKFVTGGEFKITLECILLLKSNKVIMFLIIIDFFSKLDDYFAGNF